MGDTTRAGNARLYAARAGARRRDLRDPDGLRGHASAEPIDKFQRAQRRLGARSVRRRVVDDRFLEEIGIVDEMTANVAMAAVEPDEQRRLAKRQANQQR